MPKSKLKDKAERQLQEDAGYRRMKNFQAKAAKEGTDYNYKSAREAGLSRDKKTKHWPSRVPSGPKEGLLLKSPRHPTFGKTVHAERKLGYKIIKKNNRLYSVKKK